MEGKTLTGVIYKYNGSLDDGLKVFKGSPSFKVSKELIDLIKSEIEERVRY